MDAQIDLMREILGRGDTFSFRAFGHSMFPLIPPGTEVTVRPLRTVPPPVGTVLIAERDGTLVCHRLVRLGRREEGTETRRVYHLRGDNNAMDDPPFEEADVIGELDSIRYGIIGLSSDFVPFKLGGSAWAMFPRPARLGVSVLRRLFSPARRVAETLHGRAVSLSTRSPGIRQVTPGDLGSFQSRAVHLGLAFNRDRTSRLRDDMTQGRALLVEAVRGTDLVGALLVVTGEISGAGWIEFLRLAYPRRGTGLDYDLVEEAIRMLPSLGFRTLNAESDRPLSERRLRRLGFKPREHLHAGSRSWRRRL